MNAAALPLDAGATERRRGLRAMLGAVLAMAVVGAAVAGEKWFVVAAALALLIGGVVLALPRQFVVLTIALYASELLVPEPSHQLQVFVLLAIPVVAWRGLDRLWRGAPEPWTLTRVLVTAFVGVVTVVMLLRGVGFQALGGSKAGGLLYVRLLVAAGFAILLPGVRLTDRQWGRALVAMCVLSVFPLVADLTAVYLRPLAVPVASLFQLSPSVEGLVFGTTVDGGPFRWFSAMSLSAYMTLMLFLREERSSAGRLSPAIIAGLLTTFAIASLSGHRLAMLDVVGMTGLVLILDGRLTVRRALWSAAGIVAFLALLAVIADSLPVAVQRTISWIPGVHVSDAAGRSASDSVTWRLVVWILALQEVPKYVWLGRGLAYDQGDLTVARSAHLMSGEANWAIVQGYFHNGWLSLLILLGAVGLLIGFAMLVTASARHIKIARGEWKRPVLQRYHRVLTAWLLFQVASYWLIYGDVQVSFPQFFFTVGLLEALRHDDAASAPIISSAASEAVAG